MPDTKITDLSALTGAGAATGDLAVVVDVSDTTMAASGTNKKMTLDELANAVATKLGVVSRDAIWDAKGDLAVGTGADSAARLAVSATTGLAPVVQSSASGGIAWGRPPCLGEMSTVPSGASYHTFDRRYAYAGTQSLTSGRIHCVAIYLPKDLTITQIAFMSGSTALSSGSNQWFGIFDSSRNMLRLTADDGATAWGANSAKTLTLSSSYTTTTEGLHYLGCLVVASTPPTLTCSPTTGSNVLGLSPVLCGYSSTGLTNPASCPSPLAAITATQSMIYAWVI